MNSNKIITRNLREIYLIVDADLETSRAPVHKLDRLLRFNGSDGGIYVLWDHVATIQKTAGHVLAMTWITLHHLLCEDVCN